MSLSAISSDTPIDEVLQHVADLTARKAELEQQNAELSARLHWFEEQVRLAKHRQFGPSSEKTPTEQQSLMLFDEAEVTSDSEIPEPTLESVTHKRGKQKGHRAEQFKDLPVETVEYKLPDEEQVCPCCAGPLHVMGKEVSRKLKIVPATVSVIEHVRFKYTCRHCDEHEIKTPVITVPIPPSAFSGSLASPSIVAHIMSQKFVSALPLYRQEQEFERNGLQLSRQTLANWMIAGAKGLTPLYERMKADLLARDHIHADETTLQVLNEPERPAQAKSWMWLYRSGRIGPPIVLFEYQRTRSADHPKLFLKDYRGYLQVDGYGGYTGLSSEITLVGCWAHARRGFTDALAALPMDLRKSGKPTAAQVGLDFCNKLFAIEAKLKDATVEGRHGARQEQSRLVLYKMGVWLNGESAALPKSATGQAIGYCRNQWQNLTAFLEDGRLEIDNNRSERSIKPFVIGRKNWMFANTPRGATASATIYSIVETAKENGLNPFAYLTYVFEQMPTIRLGDQSSLEAIMPWAESLPTRCRVPNNKS